MLFIIMKMSEALKTEESSKQQTVAPGCQTRNLAVRLETWLSDLEPGCQTWNLAVRLGTWLSD